VANQDWLEEVQRRLAESNLPPAYIRRFMGELADHLEDVDEGNTSMEADVSSRLGDPNQVAEAAIASYRRRSFLGRHPTAAFLAFAISPVVPGFVLGCIVAAIICPAVLTGGPVASTVYSILCIVPSLLACCLGIVDVSGQAPPGVTLIVIGIVSMLTGLLAATGVLSGIVAFLYCKLARRVGMSKKWMLISCVAVAVSMLPNHYDGTCLSLLEFCQIVVPLAVGWWFMRHGRNHDQLQLAS